MPWSTEDFREILKKYEDLYNLSESDFEKKVLLDYISNLKSEIAVEELTKFEREKLSNPEEKTKIDLKINEDKDLDLDSGTCFGALTHDLYDISRFRELYPYIDEFKTKLKSILKYDTFKFNAESNIKLSKEDIFELIHDLFKSTTDEIYEIYLSLEKNKDKYINLDPTLDANDGSSFYFPIVNKNFISVGTNGNSEDIISTLSHEIGHYIGSVYNEGRYLDKDLYVEIESQFFDLISHDYFGNQLNDIYFNEMSKDRLYDYYSDAKGIIANRDILDELFTKLNKVSDPYQFYSFLADNNPEYKEVDIPEKNKYLFGYLIAVELFEIYKEDKEMAIELLKRIICKDDKKTELRRITDNVDINRRLENHVKRLKLERN